MPRPQRELDPDGGALTAFARELRALREQSGAPKFATMERRVGRAKSTLAEAAGGRHLPRWDTVADFVRACGGDPAPWRDRWEEVRRELGVSAVDPRRPAEPVAAELPLEPVPEVEIVAASEPGAEPGQELASVDAADLVPNPASVETDVGVQRLDETEKVPRRGTWRVLVAAIVLGAALVGAGVVIGRASGPEVAGPDVRAVEVQNKVALGANLLVEDRTPAYLSTLPISYCAEPDRSCKVPGTELASGAGIVAHCTTHGQGMHNYNQSEEAAEGNPDRVASDLWYRASLPDGRAGFISEVYLTASSRGGLGLSDCGPGVSTGLPVAER